MTGERAAPGGLRLDPDTSTGLRFLSHSCVLLEDDDGDLLMDPWFFGTVFNGAWSLLAPPDLDRLDLTGVRHVWISHTHPDHFHLPTLRWVRSQVEGPLTAFVRRSSNPTLRRTMADLGFDVVELRPRHTHRVTEHLALTLFTHGEDSSVVIDHRGHTILNQNDCVLDDRTLRRLTRRFPTIDVWLYQFSIGGYYGVSPGRCWNRSAGTAPPTSSASTTPATGATSCSRSTPGSGAPST